jgi:KaiC/GvpD/RAD55 family RecA-like ATPase
MKRVKVGIDGLDKVIGGGLVEGSVTILSGGPGTGKTVFGAKFIDYGASKDEHCVFVTVENKKKGLEEYLKEFGIVFPKNVKIIEVPVFTTENVLMREIESTVERNKSKRLVFDTIKIFEYLHPEPNDRWKSLMKFKEFLNKLGVTAVLCLEKENAPLESFKLEESLSDSLIVLTRDQERENVRRSLVVFKISGVSGEKMHRMEINKKGITVF